MAAVVPRTYIPPKMLSWETWLKEILDDLSEYQDNNARYVRAKELRQQLYDAHHQAVIDEYAIEFGMTLIDAVLMGFFKHPVGVRCRGVTDCEAQCKNSQKCATMAAWSRLFPGTGLKDSKVRLCAFLTIHVPSFNERIAKRIGIYEKEAW